MKTYYFSHCRSLHPLTRSQVLDEHGVLVNYPQVVVCPVCASFCWLSHAYEAGTDDPEHQTDDPEH
jgi:hypothetical protein